MIFFYSEALQQLKQVVDDAVGDIQKSLELLRKDLVKTVSTSNVNGVLVIGRAVQAIKKVKK